MLQFRLHLAVLALLLAITCSACAQPMDVTRPTWAMERSDGSTVYLDVRQGVLLVWQRLPGGKCTYRLPEAVRWTGDGIAYDSGTQWKMVRVAGELYVFFGAGHVVRYSPARLDPAIACGYAAGEGA